jgi:hypothetical protein
LWPPLKHIDGRAPNIQLAFSRQRENIPAANEGGETAGLREDIHD